MHTVVTFAGFWVVIILLFVAIIVVAVVPGGKSL